MSDDRLSEESIDALSVGAARYASKDEGYAVDPRAVQSLIAELSAHRLLELSDRERTELRQVRNYLSGHSSVMDVDAAIAVLDKLVGR